MSINKFNKFSRLHLLKEFESAPSSSRRNFIRVQYSLLEENLLHLTQLQASYFMKSDKEPKKDNMDSFLLNSKHVFIKFENYLYFVNGKFKQTKSKLNNEKLNQFENQFSDRLNTFLDKSDTRDIRSYLNLKGLDKFLIFLPCSKKPAKWYLLESISQVRNCLLHANGRLDLNLNKEKIKKSVASLNDKNVLISLIPKGPNAVLVTLDEGLLYFFNTLVQDIICEIDD